MDGHKPHPKLFLSLLHFRDVGGCVYVMVQFCSWSILYFSFVFLHGVNDNKDCKFIDNISYKVVY